MTKRKQQSRPRIYSLLDRAVRSRDGQKRERMLREYSTRLIQSL